MAKRLILASDSVYGPGHLTTYMMFTAAKELSSIIKELDDQRTFGIHHEREPWSRATIKKYIGMGEIKQDSWWCDIPGSTNHQRLANFERKWWTMDLERSPDWNERIVVMDMNEDFVDLITQVRVTPDRDRFHKILNPEEIVREAIEKAIAKYSHMVPANQIGDRSAAVVYDFKVAEEERGFSLNGREFSDWT